MKKSIYSLIITVTLGISGCDKIDSIPTRFTPIPATNTNVKFLMLSPDAPQVNFFANGAKISSIAPSATNAVLGFVFPSVYPTAVGYATIPSGSIKVDTKVPDSSVVTPGAIILSTTQSFNPLKFYTYAIVDSLSKISTVVVEDDPTVADPTKAYIRLANFVSNNPSVKIEIVKTSTGTAFSKIYPAVAFKSVSAFETLEAGSGEVYRIFLRNPSTDVKLDSIAAFTPTNTKKYSIYARGVFGLPLTNAKRPIITNFTNF
ncbi:MAG: DUF4397 domain-containing protein [Ferruginibacter sp.]